MIHSDSEEILSTHTNIEPSIIGVRNGLSPNTNNVFLVDESINKSKNQALLQIYTRWILCIHIHNIFIVKDSLVINLSWSKLLS